MESDDGRSNPANRAGNVGERIGATLKYAFAQLRMRRYPAAGFAHMIIFFGFLVLLLRSLILWGRGFYEPFSFWIFGLDSTLGQVYSFLKDFFALLVVVGTLVFFYYRLVAKLERMTRSTEAVIILLIIFVMMWADIFYDGADIVERHREAAVAAAVEVEPVHFTLAEPAGSVAGMMLQGASDGAITFVKHLGFWTHAALVLIFLNLLPYSKHFHVITAIPNVYAQSLDPPGRIAPLEDIDGMLEREETLGIKRIDQFTWKDILDFYTCTECGRCRRPVSGQQHRQEALAEALHDRPAQLPVRKREGARRRQVERQRRGGRGRGPRVPQGPDRRRDRS